MSTPTKLRLGDRQVCCLQALAGRWDHGPRPFPGGGWTWTNYSETVAILESLERHGLAESKPYPGGKKRRQWHITDAGLEAVKPKALKGKA